MSNVTRKGKPHRPCWNYVAENPSVDIQTLEMLESLRNATEQVREELRSLNRLLNCSNFIGIPARLKRISRNTFVAKHKKEPGRYDV
jgi:hypothetical protein